MDNFCSGKQCRKVKAVVWSCGSPNELEGDNKAQQVWVYRWVGVGVATPFGHGGRRVGNEQLIK
jgi:hypothetical protein